MRLINKPRGTGKTTQLIYTSATTGYRIVTLTYGMAISIEHNAEDLGVVIPRPVALDEFIKKIKFFGSREKGILLDDCEAIIGKALENYFGNIPVIAGTLTLPEESVVKINPSVKM